MIAAPYLAAWLVTTHGRRRAKAMEVLKDMELLKATEHRLKDMERLKDMAILVKDSHRQTSSVIAKKAMDPPAAV